MTTAIAALFVLPDGPYRDVDGVECWDRARDARTYAGPYPVIAHPPCARWGRYWFGGPSVRVRRVKGDDDGCFAAALEAVRKFGGVLEHPAASSAWQAFGLITPPRAGGWVVADWVGGWTCCAAEERRRAIRTGICQRLSSRQRLETPELFRDLLVSLVRR
jgi:hypothetical protein